MKIGFIGDTHGRPFWKEFIKDSSIDKWIFMGDYMDEDYGYAVNNDDMISNLLEIIEFKKSNPDNIVLLYGNHDNAYRNSAWMCSRFRPKIAHTIRDIFTKNKSCFQNAYQINDIICTHAGISQKWFTECFKGDHTCDIAKQLNDPLIKNVNSLYNVGWSRGGSDIAGGIFWADSSELTKPLENYTQIVGHNRVTEISEMQMNNSKIIAIDCLTTKKDFLTIEIETNEK